MTKQIWSKSHFKKWQKQTNFIGKKLIKICNELKIFREKLTKIRCLQKLQKIER